MFESAEVKFRPKCENDTVESSLGPALGPTPVNVVKESPATTAVPGPNTAIGWKNFLIRTVFTLFMITSFLFIVYMGPLFMLVFVIALQLLCYREIIKIGYVIYKAHDLPWFRTLSWMFLFSSNYFLFGENSIGYFRVLLKKEDLLSFFVVHHRFISFCLYCACIIGFVLSLRKRHYLKQFTLFGYTHVTLLIIVTSSHFIMQCIFLGIIWFFLPCSMIIANDIFAYLVGYFFGRTPLIKLSPKKTWEGFIGGALCTMGWTLLAATALIHFDYFVCPVKYDEERQALSMDCVRNPIFVAKAYELPLFMQIFSITHVNVYPALFHLLVLSLFASLVGPFGGFFASGFKRAFNLKDFSDIIPGHGGVMDRFDCQILMGAFTFVYYHSFIKVADPSVLLNEIYFLSTDEQLEFYRLLTEGLIRRGVLLPTNQ